MLIGGGSLVWVGLASLFKAAATPRGQCYVNKYIARPPRRPPGGLGKNKTLRVPCVPRSWHFQDGLD